MRETKEPAFYAKTRAEWRAWLAKHHATEKMVWLVQYNKASGMPGLTYAEGVEEALCFGWIDSTRVKRDAQSTYQYFTPRKPKSNWSKPNRERVEKLTAQGLMEPAGQAMVGLAKKTGTWEALVGIENGVIPPDLQALFDTNETAYINFMAFSPSARKMILAWIMEAKRPETRQKRIAETVAKAADNVKAH